MTSFQEGMLVSVNVQRPLTAEKMELISKLVAIDMRLTDPEQKPAEISTLVPKYLFKEDYMPEVVQVETVFTQVTQSVFQSATQLAVQVS